jgi:hypothetical protein
MSVSVARTLGLVGRQAICSELSLLDIIEKTMERDLQVLRRWPIKNTDNLFIHQNQIRDISYQGTCSLRIDRIASNYTLLENRSLSLRMPQLSGFNGWLVRSTSVRAGSTVLSNPSSIVITHGSHSVQYASFCECGLG